MKTIVLFAILSICFGRYLPLFEHNVELSTVPLRIDHFNSSDDRTYECRYNIDLSYYDADSGAIFVNMGGEGGMRATSEGEKVQDRSVSGSLAQQFKAAQLSLEHRYYGESLPFSNFTTENLKYLQVEQALADVYEFIQWAISQGQVSAKSPILTIGGSYSGAMSAWFRHTYPNITAGAWASSAVINTTIDNWQMDYQVYLSTLKSGEECTSNVQKLESQVADALKDPSQNKQLKDIFKASHLTDVEYQWMLADTMLQVVQYGQRTDLCASFTSMDNLLQQVTIIYNQFSSVNNGIDYYSPSTVNKMRGGWIARQWWYQKCTEIAYFQTANKNTSASMRSQSIDLQFYKDACQTIYEEPIFPDGSFYEKFGGVDIDATNIFFGNGNEDPWKQDSLYEESRGSLTAYVVPGTDKGHCCDMSDPTAIKLVGGCFSKYISEHYAKINQQ